MRGWCEEGGDCMCVRVWCMQDASRDARDAQDAGRRVDAESYRKLVSFFFFSFFFLPLHFAFAPSYRGAFLGESSGKERMGDRTGRVEVIVLAFSYLDLGAVAGRQEWEGEGEPGSQQGRRSETCLCSIAMAFFF